MNRSPALLVIFALVFTGCDRTVPVTVVKAPRPVSTVPLRSGLPPAARRVAGSVESWKTEQIGFEVDGRVRWIVEPGAEIEGRVLDTKGDVVTEGTPLGQIDAEKYELAVAAAEADVEVAELKRDGVRITLEESVPANLKSAKSDLNFAKAEYDRVAGLVRENAAARADLDQVAASLSGAQASVKTLEAKVKQTEAELNAATAAINQANQQLKDARRSLADATLYSSFRGQVADVAVAPGSLVQPGVAALTVQMMNPIKVTVPVSAEESRAMRRRSGVPVFVTMPNGSITEQNGFVYLVSPNADLGTRTFSLELLMLNQQLASFADETARGEPEDVGHAASVYGMDLDFLPEAPEGTYFVNSRAIRKDADGAFVWIATNAKVGEVMPPLIDVRKLRITPLDREIPFIGDLILRTVRINPGQDADPSVFVYVGELLVDEGTADDWNGSQVTLTSPAQWMLRPGDVVSVDLGAAAADGYFVPIDAIYEESGATYVFAAVESDGETVARRLPVETEPPSGRGASTARRVTFIGETPPDGTPIIVGGVHYLIDGEQVAVRNNG